MSKHPNNKGLIWTFENLKEQRFNWEFHFDLFLQIKMASWNLIFTAYVEHAFDYFAHIAEAKKKSGQSLI